MGRQSGRPGRGPRDGSDHTAAENPLDQLLEEMRDLRLTLAADLTAAAGAAEAGADGVAADIVEADRLELARFARVADQRLLRLQRLAVAGPQAPTWRRRLTVALPVVPVVGALAVSAAAASGVLPLPSDSHPRKPAAVAIQSVAQTPATSSFRQLVDVIGANPSASQVIAAAGRLHRQLARLMDSSPGDPGSAAEIAELLNMEQSLLLREQPPGAGVVLSETRRLAARLGKVAPELVSPTSIPTALPTVAPSKKPPRTVSSPKPSASPKPSSTSSSSNTKSSTRSTPSPSSTPFPTLPN